MCGARAVRSIVAGLVAVLFLTPLPAHPWDVIGGVTALALDPQTPTTTTLTTLLSFDATNGTYPDAALI